MSDGCGWEKVKHFPRTTPKGKSYYYKLEIHPLEFGMKTHPYQQHTDSICLSYDGDVLDTEKVPKNIYIFFTPSILVEFKQREETYILEEARSSRRAKTQWRDGNEKPD